MYTYHPGRSMVWILGWCQFIDLLDFFLNEELNIENMYTWLNFLFL